VVWQRVLTERYDLARWKTAEDTLSYIMARGPFNGLAYGIACSFFARLPLTYRALLERRRDGMWSRMSVEWR